ncbi:SARP family transcriptional regulator [Arthrobacter sp. zg-Y1110]|uniref:AfsR/SARP family transcriptional regulator n=1 Tax=Arthrobacter sp. zg-Y1110 TaxID=2886932 RepID=UPI001D138450|nr:SARP family transcriptional regulator [Arthrobacter sp. zg-Y1110]MCC3291205.1 SARP family transcriptional regulator [Arthrobacter sp. zg-Y1110]UWX83636.1 SARP family transcriptional regulator [Arthrobacter sp. zg-Y1110]
MAGIKVRLLGPPSIECPAGDGRQPRGRKGWGLLTYLLLHRIPTPRGQLAAMLFPDAGDPLGALRWHLSDLRRVLGPGSVLQGDPLILRLPPSSSCDADTAVPWSADTASAELLERLEFADCPGFDTWLTVERHRLRHFVETAAYERGLAALADGDTGTAVQFAGQAVRLDQLNGDFHALLVRALLAGGDRSGAREQATRCARLFAEHLGLGMPAEVQQALAAPDVRITALPATAVAVRSYLEAAASCLAAGAATPALAHLRVAGGLAERTRNPQLQAEALLALAGALIHGAGGRGAEVADLLHRVVSLSGPDGSPAVQAAAYRELGFLAVQRGFPASGLRWLARALALASAAGLTDETARVLGVRGMLATDTADYPAAAEALAGSAGLSTAGGNLRQEAFARAMLGRLYLLTGQHRTAAEQLDASLMLLASEHWAAFRPLVEALRSEAYLFSGDSLEAAEMADHAVALAEAFGDRCYLDSAFQAKARVLLAAGERAAAEEWIRRGLRPDPWYRWFRGRNLDFACTVSLHSDPPLALVYARELTELSSRYGHDELTVRAYSFRAALGDSAVETAIPLLAARITNPRLRADLAGLAHGTAHAGVEH